MSEVGYEVIANEAITEKERRMLRMRDYGNSHEGYYMRRWRKGNNKGWARSLGDEIHERTKNSTSTPKGQSCFARPELCPKCHIQEWIVAWRKKPVRSDGESVSRAMMTTDWHLWNTNVRTQSSRDRWVGQRSLDHTRYPLQQVRGIVRFGESTHYA